MDRLMYLFELVLKVGLYVATAHVIAHTIVWIWKIAGGDWS